MLQQEKQYMLNGILGTIAFHMIILVAFLTFRIGEVKNMHQELIEIEFAEEEFKTIEEIIEENKPDKEAITPLSNEQMSNIASNVADEMNEEISTEKYIEELMKEMDIEDLNPQHDNTLPEEAISSEKTKEKKEVKTNFGQTRITYNVTPNRQASYIDRPIYRCQGGGEVVVAIVVDQQGYVTQAQIKSSSTSEECIHETAIASAQNFMFERDAAAPKKVNGTITYIFVAQ
jgi:TonB family protein